MMAPPGEAHALRQALEMGATLAVLVSDAAIAGSDALSTAKVLNAAILLQERLLRVRATTSKSVHAREIALPVEVVKELDHYLRDVRRGELDEDAPLFTNRQGRSLSATAIRRLFDRLKVRTGSTFDLQIEGGWTTARMVDGTAKVRPLAERRRSPSPFTAPKAARTGAEIRPSEMRPSQQKDAPGRKRPLCESPHETLDE